jgi:hypothetical protein
LGTRSHKWDETFANGRRVGTTDLDDSSVWNR